VRGTVLSVAARLALEEAAALRWPRKEEPAAGAARIFLGSRSRIAAPIRRGDLHYGALVAESSRAEAFGVHDFQALQTLADHAAVALDNARLFGELRAEREKSDRIIRTMADGMLTLDGRGNVTAMNPAAELLTGWAEPDALGRAACAVVGCGRRPEPARSPIALGGAFPEGGNGHDPPALAPGPECAGTCKLMAALQLGVVVHEERWASRSPAGGERVFGLSAAPLPGEGAPSGVVVMLRDATEREEMERFQRELVATFSHELRAPLANIDAIIQTAALSPEAFPDDLVEKMRSQNRRLAELAERTLDVARLDDGRWRLEPRPLPAGMAASEAAERLAGRRPDRPVVVQAERPTPWAWGDEVAVATVLDNFLDNADKYSMPGAKVSVEVLRHPAGGVLFAVTDRGPGIAPEHRARVFDRFYRADGADSRRSYGHGLGLYIARRLVEGMGGRIWVESPETGGSRFVFTLPSPPEDGHEDPDHRG
jgi:signal transduction histidine kinase